MSPFFLFNQKDYMTRLKQRLGDVPPLPTNGRMVLWIHCVSVGEINAARPIFDKIIEEYPKHRIVVSTTTLTGNKLAREIFMDKADAVFYFPFDWRFSVRRALRKIKPDVILIMETELWFNFLREAYKSGAHIAIINGRLSEKSVKRYFWIHKMMKRVLRYIDIALMQDHKSAKRLVQLGVLSAKVEVTGNMKFDQAIEDNKHIIISNSFAKRFDINKEVRLIIAASTHHPEESMILEAFKKVWKSSSGIPPRLMVAPRHPERFEEVEQLIRKTGFNWVRRTEKESSKDKVAEIILLDSIGELREVFSLAEIVFVGGSLIPHGGQSLLEPAVHGKAIATGFYTTNFEEITKTFVDRNAVIQLPKLNRKETVVKLVEVFNEMLKDNEKRRTLAQNASALVKDNRGAAEKTIEYLRPLMEVKKSSNFPSLRI